jgi:hypothetical protein
MVKYILAFVLVGLYSGALVHLNVSLTETREELYEAKLHVGEILVREDSYQRDVARRLAKKTVALENQEELLARAAIEIEAHRLKVAEAVAEAYDWQSSYRGQTASLESLKRDVERVRCKPVVVKPVVRNVIKCSNGICKIP